MSTRAILASGAALLVLIPASLRGAVLSEIKHLHVNELKVSGFVLDQEGEVSIEAVAYRDFGVGDDFALNNAWILAAETREVVWTLSDAESEKRSKRLREFSDDVRLPKGRYEVYYSTYWPAFNRNGDLNPTEGLGDVITRVVREMSDKTFDEKSYRKAVSEFRITVTGTGEPLSEEDVVRFHDRLKEGAILSLTKLGNDFYRTIGLKIEKPVEFQVYAVGELAKRERFDYCWIIDTSTHEKVWKFDYSNSDFAGGAKKNRSFKGVVPLAAGNYALLCATDDSHAFGDWNSPPPYDAYFWGVTIQTADPETAKYVQKTEYEDFQPNDVVLEITGLGDGETRSEGITLKKDSKLRVFALGEGNDTEMYDYSWIVNASTREPVWEMTADHTEHAGGASKNRVVDEVIDLAKGNYIVYAVTDDSHSFKRWNSSHPQNPERWGITLLTTGGSRSDVAAYDEGEDTSVLARIVKVGDSEDRSERFHVDKAGPVRIYALGEGRHGEMFDYAWIEDAGSDRVVWEMTYKMTHHAGGAKKNRMVDDIIDLDAGEYIVHYESDGSHSYKEWNASPPADPANWGVTVGLARREIQ